MKTTNKTVFQVSDEMSGYVASFYNENDAIAFSWRMHEEMLSWPGRFQVERTSVIAARFAASL